MTSLVKQIIPGLALLELTFASANGADVSQQIVVDPFGWRASASNKVVVFANPMSGQNAAVEYVPGSSFQVRRASDHSVAFAGNVVPWNGGATHAQSGDQAWWGDFSDLTAPGEYYIHDASNDLRSFTFRLGDDVFNGVLKAAVRAFYYQRCGTAITAEYGGNWTHALCHAQDGAATLWTTSDQGHPRDVSGGWHDAGDYNKYVPFTLSTLWHLMTAYELAPRAFGDDTGIPESGNRVPDLLDEVKWELDWMLRMQDTNGAVFNRVAVLSYGNDDPQNDTLKRYYTRSATWATATAAAAWAHGARLFQQFDAAYPGYAGALTAAAQKAWSYLETQPDMHPADGTDGASMAAADAGSDSADDKRRRVLAAAELYATTGTAKYRAYFDGMVTNVAATADNGHHPLQGDWPSMLPDGAWALNAALIVYAQTPFARNESIVNKALFSLGNGADWYPTGADESASDPYRAYMWDGHYCWGSNRMKALWAMLPILAIRLNVQPSRHDLYRRVAEEYLHYLHGRNPLSFCYLSNMGTRGAALGAERCLMEPYHGWFKDGSPLYDGAASTYGPAPGFLAGGPNVFFSKSFVAPPFGEPHQKAFKDWNTGWNASQADNENSWEITEPGIYYQAAYVAALAAYCSDTPDTDFDGMPDDWERTYFGDLLRDGDGDWDGDGMSDRDEFRAGSNPTDRRDALAMRAIMPIGQTNLLLQWSSASNRFYAIAERSDWTATAWHRILTNIPASPPMNCRTVSVSGAQSFFRIEIRE